MNICIFTGNLGSDPELAFTPSGTAVCRFSIAVNERWKDKNGQTQEKTEWIRIVAFNKQAEVMGEHLKKGSKIAIKGGYHTNKWADKEGNNRETVEIKAEKFWFLDSKIDSPQSAGSYQAKPQAQSEDLNDSIPF